MFAEGQLVKEANRPEVFVIWGGARLHVPSAQEFDAMGYRWASVTNVPDGSLAGVARVPLAGTLLRERSRPEVYVIRDGRRLHIPSAYTFDALGYQWSLVRRVPNGCLTHIPIELWPTLSPTPGSVVCLPYGSVWYPLRAPGTKVHRAWGQEVRTIELRGWLTGVGEDCNPVDPDWYYDLVLDTEWASQAGIDLNSVVKLGNILQLGLKQPGATQRAWIAEPQIHLEVSGWPPKEQRQRPRPPDWVAHESPLCPGTVPWPFNCRNPRPADPPLAPGQYVRAVGSIISDKPHRNPADEHSWLQERWFVNSNFETELTRWTELHPPDTIEVIDQARPRTETFRGVAVAALGAFTGWPVGVTDLDVEIPAPARPPGNAVLQVRELVGQAETDFSTIVEGNSARTGARLTLLEDRVQVFIRVRGKKSIFGGSPGKFKALYRVFWELLVPDVVGKRRAAAEADVRTAGLKPIVTGSDAPGAQVFRQTPAAGARVPPQSAVKLEFGTEETTIVPDVMGHTREEAASAVTAAGLVPRISGRGFVTTQSPRGGAMVRRGTSVALTLAIEIDRRSP